MTEVLCGAGILPFCISDKGELLFILGKEQSVQNWKGSERWSAFEGGTKNNENCIQNATREFEEETLNCLTNKSTHVLEAELNDELFAAKLSLSIQYLNSKKIHVTYVKQFDYVENLESKFIEKLNFMQNMSELQQQFDFIRYKNINLDIHPFHKIGDIINIESKECKITDIKYNYDSKFFTIDLLLKYKDQEQVLHLSSTHEMNLNAKEYFNWYANQQSIKKNIERINRMKKEIHCQCDSEGNVTEFKVNTDFMEKSIIRYWNVEDLKQVVEKNGTHKDESFRPYFMYVLKETLNLFGNPQKYEKNTFIKIQEDINLI